MTESNKTGASLTVTVILAALNLVALNLLLSGWSTARLDLTGERVYSISAATERILDSLDEDVLIHGYFSRRTHPELAPLVPRIRDLLEEYAARGRGRIQVEIFDPREDTEAEKEANERFGVVSTPFRLASKYEAGIVNAYFALVIRHGDQYVRYGFEDLIEIDPLPGGDVDIRLRNMEYDLTRAIKKVVYGFRGGAELFERVEEPFRFTVVMTPGTLPEIFAEIPEAVRTAATELKEKGGDKFIFEEIDPSTGEEASRAVYERFGARPMALGLFGDQTFYLYGFLESGGMLEQMALAAEDVTAATVREAIEDSLRRHTPGYLKTVGVSAPEPSIPPEVLMQFQMQGRTPPQPPPEYEQLKMYLGRDYNVADVALDAPGGVPSEVDTLVVIKPKKLPARAVYNLDQYLMRGGRVIVCSGNWDVQFDQSGLRLNPFSSGIDPWLEHHGVAIDETLVLDDRNQPLPIPEVRNTPLGAMRTWRLAPYPYLVEVREDGLVNREIAGSLDAMAIYWGSPLTVDEEKTGELEVIEILRSSRRSWTSDDITPVNSIDYEVPAEGLEPRILAVALRGSFRAFYAGKEPPPAREPLEGEDIVPPAAEVPLEESPETRLVVIGNAEFLSDFVAQALGTTESGFFSENLAFMQNLIDWTNLDSDLISIRSRGIGARRLGELDPGVRIVVETMNYVIPVAALLLLAFYRWWRRRNAVPILQQDAAGDGGTER